MKRTVTVVLDASLGEYRVPGPDGTEAQAYYTDDRQDARGTAKLMYGDSPQQPVTVKFRTINR